MLSYLEHVNYKMAVQFRIRNDKNMEELVLEEVNKSDNHKNYYLNLSTEKR